MRTLTALSLAYRSPACRGRALPRTRLCAHRPRPTTDRARHLNRGRDRRTVSDRRAGLEATPPAISALVAPALRPRTPLRVSKMHGK